MTRDFEELLGLLKRHGVKAVAVGAHALAHHAKPRYTKDIDILIEPTEENALGREALMRNKRASARPQDLADLQWLEGELDDVE